ncbi:hypothetical protein D7Y13_31090 [Corallococcus praedator]|uniref:Head-to-tail adaptor n=2 Tax=Myxococcaceae TaxID=31 RepID=A0ABX9Q974_9BACT|nr:MULTISPECIES: hypothetical protein [Corallococcus]RKH06254.1 hypothetical protein D7X74_33925 [Corallococcus sp. CA047B]RKH22561.1 hypothetical protein D7X75_35305 [Corallococcus sp. CA031C]RKH96358.1 hypothetical protein D7Y13_31090 [Corallococcus praedator]
MKYNPDFDVDSVLDVLKGVNEKYEEGSPEDEALRIAAVALVYVREAERLEEYRGFFRSFFTPAIESVIVSQTFSTREEAETWLALGVARDGELIRVAGQGFQVILAQGDAKPTLLRTPLPEELMKKFPPGPG